MNAASDDRLSIANATFYIFLDAGVGVGPLLQGLFVPAFGYSALFLGMAVLILAAFAVFLAVRRFYR